MLPPNALRLVVLITLSSSLLGDEWGLVSLAHNMLKLAQGRSLSIAKLAAT